MLDIIRKRWESGNSVSSDHQRKLDTGEFIPLGILKDVLESKNTSKNNKHLRVEAF
jgi:hypothetical protein